MTIKKNFDRAKKKLKQLTSGSDSSTGGDSEDVGFSASTISSTSSIGDSIKPEGLRKNRVELSDESDGEVQANDVNFGKIKFVDSNQPATWNVLVRIIEAQDVDAAQTRVRVNFDGKVKMTRTVTQATPKWRQNLLFTCKNQSLEKLAANILSIKLVRPTFTSEQRIGDFSCYLSEVIHSTNKSIIAKWVALGYNNDDDESDDSAYENCGFLKVSICVYRMDETPPSLIDDDGSEQIWSGAHLTDYTIKFRLFSIEMLAKRLIAEKKMLKKPQQHQQHQQQQQQKFLIQIECGGQKCETTMEAVNFDENDGRKVVDIVFEQEIYLPIQWPTVVSQMKLKLFSKRGKQQRCIGTAVIPMRNIYEPGEMGFLPTFGPAYLNLFDYERVTRFNWFLKGTKTLPENGSRFVCRLFLSIDCVEYMGESIAQRMFLDHSSIKEAESFMKDLKNYTCFCSMSALNLINPLFASDAIQILVSIGSFGSTSSENKYPNSSTVAAMPNWDGCKYFAMPWGNLRPVTEVNCTFETIENRIELSNSLMKIVDMLNQMIWEVRRIGNGAIDRIASVGCETLDHFQQMVEAAEKYLSNCQFQHSNFLDRNWLETRRSKIAKLKEHLIDELFDVDYSDDEVDSKLLRTMLRIRDLSKEIAEDVQLSIPPVIIKMMSFGKLIGFAKIPITEIYQAEREAESGQWCGQSRPINIQWPTLFDQKNRKEEFVAVLHAKMWFGRRECRKKWKEHVEPAEIRHFMEVYELESKNMLSKWKATEANRLFNSELKPINLSGSSGAGGGGSKSNKNSNSNTNEDCGGGRVPESLKGWKSIGQWIVMNTHDVWMSTCGSQTMHDKAYEVQHRNSKGEWGVDKGDTMFTDYYGYELKEAELKKSIDGWEMSSWAADKLRNNGDKNGWIYSTNSIFVGDAGTSLDREAKPHHNYRRRCIKRSRKLVAYKKEHEEFETYRSSLDDTNWEYSVKKKGPYHDIEEPIDQYRRRRFIIEMEKQNDEAEGVIYRLYEHQLVTAKWQLRCYIMWAKDLLPVIKNSARAFVRISFSQHTKQTLLVDNSQNPIWNETVMFRSILIAGGARDITHNPPQVSVEVVGECANNAEMHLGRFETSPTVICTTSADARATPLWYPLKFPKGQTRGAILACFELFEQTDNKDCLPLEPANKSNFSEKKEIPAEMRPQFDKYHVQFLCWGVRNLKKHQLLTVRRPFVEMTIGDQEFCLEALKDVRTNPNFPEPMITFSEVALPSALELSPPFVVNLYDSRAFNRKPLIGTCLISDLHKYVSHIIPKKNTKDDENYEWIDYDSTIEDQHEKMLEMPRIATLSTDPMVPLDWWSRYYASMSQFHRAPGYLESGLELIRIYKKPLEEMGGYNNFGDFLDTFQFVKNSKGDFDDPDEKEKAGELKCRLLITKLKKDATPPQMNASVDFVGAVKCVCRIYVIEAIGLVSSSRATAKIDSYLLAKCGKQIVNLRKSSKSDTSTDPVYGECIEMTVTIPMEKDLKIAIMDRRLLIDDEIGSTTIDLENRLLTKWRATCGLSAQYTIQGEHQWRDQATPLEILKSYCIRMQIPTPKIVWRQNKSQTKEPGIEIYSISFWYSEVMTTIEKDEKRILENQREKAGKETKIHEGGAENDENEAKPTRIPKISSAENEKERFGRVKKTPTTPTTLSTPVSSSSASKPEDADVVRNSNRRRICGPEIEQIALFILRQINLVEEHVETRPLYSMKNGKSLRGSLRLFVDIFPHETGPIPAPFDISPRKPIEYQLRLAVMRVTAAIPIKRSFGEPVNDIYVKAFVNGMTKSQKTDTHFRVNDGNGEFNWRFLLNFDYNPWEKKVVSYTKTKLFRKPMEELVDPLIIIQLWDKNKLKKDVLLGELELDMLEMLEGVGSPTDVGVYSTTSRDGNRRSRRLRKCVPKCCTKRGCLCVCCVFCFQTRCFCRWRKRERIDFPKPVKYFPPTTTIDEGHPNLFNARNLYGWWPMLTSKYPHVDADGAKKKDDDVNDGTSWIMGLVEMDMMLVTKDEAKSEPIGKKRSEPNHSPYLEQPNRKGFTNFWICSRMFPCFRYVWKYYGSLIVFWIIAAFFIILAVYFLLSTWPVVFAQILTKIW